MKIETARLRLRPLAPDDVDELHQLFTEVGVRKYLWDDEVIPRERTASIVEASIASFDAQGFGLWAVRPKDAETLIGLCGFWLFHEPPQLELLYGLSSSAWHNGFAAEAASAMIRHGVDALSFTRVDASTDGANVASVRVMERAGMTFWKREMTNGLDTIYYSTSRET